MDAISLNGSGCPSSFANWRQDGNLIIDAQSYSVTLDEGRLERKNCQLTLDTLKPEGWTYRVARVRLDGWARASGSVDVSARVSHYIQGSLASVEKQDIHSWFRGNYKLETNEKGEWAPCETDRALNINTSLLLRRSSDAWASACMKFNQSGSRA